MTPETLDWTSLDETASISLADLARASGMGAEEVAELVEYGALVTISTSRDEPVFSASCVPPLRAASRLRQDYDLDIFTVVLLMESLTRIEALERKIRALEAMRGARA